MTDDVSPMVVTQRIRNRIIEYLEVASSFEMQQDYQAKAAFVHVPSEMFNQWEDWVQSDKLDWFVEPVFSMAEQAAIRKFDATLRAVAGDTPSVLPELSDLIGTEPWDRLRTAAEAALEVFQVRGKFDEQREVF